MRHRTTNGGGDRGPWLTSLVMYANTLQHLDADAVTVDELAARARTTRLSLKGLRRWGYLRVEDDRVRLTEPGRRAQAAWAPLRGEIEARWRDRFGASALDRLRDALGAVRAQVSLALPDYLPVVYPTQNGRADIPASAEPATDTPDLSVLLAQVLLAFTLDFEAESKLSMPVSANPLRVVTTVGVRVRDLPARTGVSKEANAMATGFLARRECIVVEPDPSAARGKVVRLTEKGERAQAKFRRVLAATEAEWRARFGDDLAIAADAIVGDESRLRAGMQPYPAGWRASVRVPKTLPHYPMVLHRGGFPDGS
jgi:DNA-binding MarR family transcriptional regulator